MDLLSFIIGLVIGLITSYFFTKSKIYQDTDISQKSTLLQSLTSQVNEMKIKFDEYEKLRIEKEKSKEKFDEEKERRYKEFMDSTSKFFQTQDEVRKSYEEKRDNQMNKFASIIEAFNRTIHGTKTRGNVGEEVLRQYLSESIKANIIKTNLKTDSGEVEFAWNLGDGNYIPIDSKFPEFKEIEPELENEENLENSRREIINKTKTQIDRVKKYLNQNNTINKAILAIPERFIEIAPEIIELGASKNIMICSQKQVFLIGYILAEEYEKLKDEGDIGKLKNTNSILISILKEIYSLTDTLERQAKSVITHNDKIKDKLKEGLRL